MENVYSLLKNKVYLYLLTIVDVYEPKTINYTEWAQKIGISRQTVANEYKELLDWPISLVTIKDKKIVKVSNIYHVDIFVVRDLLEANFSGITCAYLLIRTLEPKLSKEEICKKIDISVQALYSHKLEITTAYEIIPTDFIYLVVYKSRILYVECSSNMNYVYNWFSRYPYLTQDNFIILERCLEVNSFERLQLYKSLLKPPYDEVEGRSWLA